MDKATLVNELVEQGRFYKRGEISQVQFVQAVNHLVDQALPDFERREALDGECGRCGSMPGKRDLTCPKCSPDGVPVVAQTVTDEQLSAAFELATGGPNPFYRCRDCSAVIPGVREELVRHAIACGVQAVDPQTKQKGDPDVR